MAQFASVVDGCDGEVSRLKFQSSQYGGWFDAVLDRYADAMLLFGLTWHLFYSTDSGDSFIWLIGFAAIIGSFMLSYTADKYDNLMSHKINASKGFRLGRDIRVLLICIDAMTNQLYGLLVLIAVVMNIETLRRIVILHESPQQIF